MVREMDENDLLKSQDDNLPGYVVTNIHGFTKPPFAISITGHRICCNKIKIVDSTVASSVHARAPASGPRFPIDIRWYPKALHIDVKHYPSVTKLIVTNACYRSLYIRTCGFLNDSIRLGSWWRCFPRTRFLLAPGLSGEIFVHAIPKRKSTVPFASSHLILVTEHLRDQALIYYHVELNVTFHNYETKGE